MCVCVCVCVCVCEGGDRGLAVHYWVFASPFLGRGEGAGGGGGGLGFIHVFVCVCVGGGGSYGSYMPPLLTPFPLSHHDLLY